MTAHPTGCAAMVHDWVGRARAARSSLAEAARAAGKPQPKAVLVIGCSSGYGLASRVTAAFSCGARTLGVSYEREPGKEATASPGWYNNRAFDREAAAAGVYAGTLNLDAFSDAAKAAVIHRARVDGLVFDQVIYSLASPVRRDPKTGVLYKSSLRPIGQPFSGLTVDPFTAAMSHVTVEPADDEKIAGAVKVMGGEDWELWMDALAEAGVLARGCVTLAYSYIGPEHSYPIYRYGTMGRAKEHLERTAPAIKARLGDIGGSAYVSVNKALVTRASSVIPVIPLYITSLFKTMKQMGLHEDCVDQILRLYRDRLFAAGPVPVDEAGRIRLDDWEMRFDVQEETARRMREATEANLEEIADLAGYRHDFMQAHGFDLPGVDYAEDVSLL